MELSLKQREHMRITYVKHSIEKKLGDIKLESSGIISCGHMST